MRGLKAFALFGFIWFLVWENKAGVIDSYCCTQTTKWAVTEESFQTTGELEGRLRDLSKNTSARNFKLYRGEPFSYSLKDGIEVKKKEN